jgi:hypothetical protein
MLSTLIVLNDSKQRLYDAKSLIVACVGSIVEFYRMPARLKLLFICTRNFNITIIHIPLLAAISIEITILLKAISNITCS